jgi:hypothetical protein
MLVAVDGRWKVNDRLHHLPLVCGSDGHVYSNLLELEHAKYITGAEGNTTSETL